MSVLAQPPCKWPSECTGVGRRSLKPLGFPEPSLPFLWDNTDPCIRLIRQGGAMHPEKKVMRTGIIMMHNCFPELSWRKQRMWDHLQKWKHTDMPALPTNMVSQASLTSAACGLPQQLLYLKSYQSCALAAVEIHMLWLHPEGNKPHSSYQYIEL